MVIVKFTTCLSAGVCFLDSWPINRVDQTFFEICRSKGIARELLSRLHKIRIVDNDWHHRLLVYFLNHLLQWLTDLLADFHTFRFPWFDINVKCSFAIIALTRALTRWSIVANWLFLLLLFLVFFNSILLNILHNLGIYWVFINFLFLIHSLFNILNLFSLWLLSRAAAQWLLIFVHHPKITVQAVNSFLYCTLIESYFLTDNFSF